MLNKATYSTSVVDKALVGRRLLPQEITMF